METKTHSLPSLPGVYLFKDAFDHIIYIGKAKSLKKRVASYFHKTDSDWKVQALIDEHETIEHIVTHSETDALLLEAQLIKEYQPKFNVLLKSGQPFVYLLFTQSLLPDLEIVRNKKRKGKYFGPFLHKQQARNVHEYLVKTFKLLKCKKKIDGGCLHYHLDLCAGTCKKDFDEESYLFRINLAQSILKGRFKKSLRLLEEKIDQHCKKLEFEKAKSLSKYVQDLEVIFNTLRTKYSTRKYEKDVVLATTPMHKKTIPNYDSGKKLQALLQLQSAPETIDCFDISHFQSNAIVGSCIRFKNGIPDKNNFRRFKIKSLDTQNDYAALQEIVSRRYKNPEDIPDLVLIDGGKGQLSAIQQIFPDINCISLAKREETIFSDQFPHGLILDQKTEEAKLLLAVRDYAHHFAISYHRYKRNKKF